MAYENTIIWILVNCNSLDEAKNIGNSILKKRLASCFDVFSRELAKYFWPPKSDKFEESKGALLILETIEEKYEDIVKSVEEVHSDEEPFIGFVEIKGIRQSYLGWMNGELR
ncbi:MAG: divalent cation tolerance protein CutA [Candidatus Nanoarchaeia archaeon]